MISAIVAAAFMRSGAYVKEGPAVVSPGVEAFTVHHRGVDTRVVVVCDEGAVEQAAKAAGNAALIVNLTGRKVAGRVAPREKLDVILSTVGLDTETLRMLCRYRLHAAAPTGSPVSFLGGVVEGLALLRYTPLLYPYVVAGVSYRRVERWLFFARVVEHSGRAIVDALAASYCTYSRAHGLECEPQVKQVPGGGDLELLKFLSEHEGSILTPEALAKTKGVPLERAEEMLERLADLGFAVAGGGRAYRLARIYPPLSDGDPFAGSAWASPEWVFFPFKCVKGLHDRLQGILAMLEAITGGPPRGVALAFYPYLVAWAARGHRKEMVVYDPIRKRPDERVAGVIKQLGAEDCLYLSCYVKRA